MSLIDQAAKKSSVLWIDGRLAWHVFHDGAIYLIVGGEEQDVPLAPNVQVTLRSKDSWGALVTFEAAVEAIEPGSEEWEGIVPVLAKERLNAHDVPTLPERWARDSRIVRLRSLR